MTGWREKNTVDGLKKSSVMKQKSAQMAGKAKMGNNLKVGRLKKIIFY